MWGEVVHVGLGGIELDAAGCARGVNNRQYVRVVEAANRSHDARGGLIVRVREDVGAADVVEFGERPARGGNDMGRFKVGCRGSFRELGTELSKGKVGAASLDEGEGCGIPKRG